MSGRAAADHRTSDGGKWVYGGTEATLSFEGAGDWDSGTAVCQLAESESSGLLSLFAADFLPEQADLLLRARLQELAVAHHRELPVAY